MNRRTALKLMAASTASLLLPDIAPAAPLPTWWTHGELMRIARTVRKHPTYWNCELVDFAKEDFNSHYIKLYLAMCRMSNYLHVRTRTQMPCAWIVGHPCLSNILPSYLFDDEPFQISSGIYKHGTLCCKWRVYTDERFPHNFALLGYGTEKKPVKLPEYALLGFKNLPKSRAESLLYTYKLGFQREWEFKLWKSEWEKL